MKLFTKIFSHFCQTTKAKRGMMKRNLQRIVLIRILFCTTKIFEDYLIVC